MSIPARTDHILLTLTGGAAQDAFGSAVAGARTKAGSFLIVGAPGAGPRHGRLAPTIREAVADARVRHRRRRDRDGALARCSFR